MLAKRLVASVTVDVRPPASEEWRGAAGDLAHTPAYAQAADELMFVPAPGIDHAAVVRRLRQAAGLLFVPVTVREPAMSREQLDELIDAGADRVYLWAEKADELAASASSRWGKQAVGLCVALQLSPAGEGWSLAGSGDPGAPAFDLARLEALAAAGAGELLVLASQADLGDCAVALRAISDRLDVPVIVAGTVRTTEGLRRVLIDGGVGGLVFEPDCVEEFEDVAQIKTYLAAAGIVVRGA